MDEDIELSNQAKAHLNPRGIVINSDGSAFLNAREAINLAKWIIQITPILIEIEKSQSKPA